MEVPKHSETTDFFQTTFIMHYPIVKRKLIALVRDSMAAEDLAQEVFLRLYRNPPDEPAVIGAWLHRVLTRIAYDYLNKRTRERALQEKQEQHLRTEEQPQLQSEQIILSRQDQEEVQEWLEELPERDRKVLMLRYSGYSYAEIAEQLQVRQPLVGTLVNRAAAKLKRHADAQAQTD